MKNKITGKLILYFLVIVIANSLITSGFFVVLGRNVYIKAHRENLIRRAENIADSISYNMDLLSDESAANNDDIKVDGEDDGPVKNDRDESDDLETARNAISRSSPSETEITENADTGSAAGHVSGSGAGAGAGRGVGRGSGSGPGSGTGNGPGTGTGDGIGGGPGSTTGQGYGRSVAGNSNAGARHMSPRFINWLDEVLDGKIWIIYKTDNIIQRGTQDLLLAYEDLTEHEKQAIDQAFGGKSNITESFHTIFEEGTLSAVAPMKDADGTVYGAALMHENITVVRDLIDSALITLLISVSFGILIAFTMIVYFARKFIQPINRIDEVAKLMIEGNYQVGTNVQQKDEIGDLSRNIDELAVRLDRSRAETENLEHLRNDFISNMSHELKTPVTVMKSSLEALVSGVIREDEVEDYHKLLYEEISVLERLVADLMELNTVKNKHFPMNFQVEDLISILKDATRSQRILAEEKGIKLVLDIEDSYFMMECDYTRLRQMLITVINNGIKYSHPSGIVNIKEWRDSDEIRIQVINRGKPIEPKERELLFESFYRAKDTSEKGFGLGLAIAKEIAVRHGITLHIVDGSEAEETIFEFIIPVLETGN